MCYIRKQTKISNKIIFSTPKSTKYGKKIEKIEKNVLSEYCKTNQNDCKKVFKMYLLFIK